MQQVIPAPEILAPVMLAPELVAANHEAAASADAHDSDAHDHAATVCLNCGHAVPDRYCGRCGQDAHHTHRLTMADMPHDVLHSIWHVDKGILYTLKTMIFRPGSTIREYLAGKRVDHFRPLSLLFMITGTFALVSALLHVDMMPPRDPNIPEAVWQMQVKLTTFMTKYMSWFYVGMVPVIALFARLFLRRGGFNYAECLIIVAFITAITNFFAFVYLPLIYINGNAYLGQNSTTVFTLAIVAYASWAYGSLLSNTTLGWFGRLWRGFLSYALGFTTSIIITVIAGFVLNWSSIKKSMIEQAQQRKAQTQQQATPPKPQP